MEDFEIELYDPKPPAQPEPAPATAPPPPPAETEAEAVYIDLGEMKEDRYSRLELIPWWKQERLRQAKILVVGAGAIGNELIKNLTLLGIGHLFIIDLDRIENSNLSRSVLFRAGDEGKWKAETAAARAEEINPDVCARAMVGDIVNSVGLGLFREMDVVLGGLDNREARLAINIACWKVNRPWVDGAIEVLHGLARVFTPPDGPCYECTLNEADYKLLSRRRSCALLTREEMLAGKVPTTPTTASIIAGMQVQEALKLLHADAGMPTLSGRAFMYNGLTHDSYVVEYTRREDCPSHETYPEVTELECGAGGITLAQMVERIRQDLGGEAILETDREIICHLRCACGNQTDVFRPVGTVTEKEAICPDCGELREPVLRHSFDGAEDYRGLTLAALGIPLWDIVRGRSGLDCRYYELRGDRKVILGSKWDGGMDDDQ